MSSLRRQVPGLSRLKIATVTDSLREQMSLIWGSCPEPFPIIDYIEKVLQVVVPEFVLEIVDDADMPGLEGETSPDRLRMKLPNSVYEGAVNGERRARFTVAHELGHLFLHRDLLFARAVEDDHDLKPYESSEWQADEFAGSLLMPERLVRSCRTVLEITERCQVSEPAAKTRLAKLKINRPHG